MSSAVSTYKGIVSFVLESEKLRAEFVAWGAKLVSLKGKSGRETLQQNPSEKFIVPTYGMNFSEGEIAGADDMFPTITACKEEYSGKALPDHGEVWALLWQVEREGETLVFTVDGIALPYTMVKRVWIEGDTLKSTYEVTNRGANPMNVLWAYHPLFLIEPEGRLEVGENTGRLMLTNSMDNRVGVFGDSFEWPTIPCAQGEFAADRGEENQNRYEKYYFKDKLSEGRCALVTANERIEMRFDPEKTGYLGVWNNQGGYLDGNQIAPQPCTAPYDRPDFAKRYGVESEIEGFGKRDWWLEIRVGKIRDKFM